MRCRGTGAVVMIPPALLLVTIGVVIERLRPSLACSINAFVFNVAYAIPAKVLETVTVALVAGGMVTVTNLAGGGLITLPADGWLLVPGVVAYVVMMDLGEYLFHRAQHRVPALWAMHSLHHSDGAMNISTTYRHFWADQALKTMTIYFLVGFLFRANPRIISIYAMVMLWNLFPHMSVRLGFGRAWALLNSPQYHRVHHSRHPEHQDRNFAGLFPIFDVIFGTAYRPCPGEFPETGLYDGDRPHGVLEAIVWPARGLFRRWRFSATRT
jgi:sterol desaturase/sphingolipid hydroxylase (fatty acid hydroxylase superfamily)